MANFGITRTMTKDQEGGFWNDPSAGWTYAGITQRYYPQWPGFAKIRAIQKTKFHGRAIPRYTIITDAALDKMVETFYKTTFWDKKVNGDYIKNQTVANFVYDFIFHKENAAIRVINNAALDLNSDAETYQSSLAPDVIDTINTDAATFYKNIYAARIKYYQTASGFSAATRKQFLARVKKFPAPTNNISGIGSFSTKEVKEAFADGQIRMNSYSENARAKTYSEVSKGIDRIVKNFPDATMKIEKGIAVIKYNKGNGTAKVAVHMPSIRDIVQYSFLEAKDKYYR